MLEERFAAIVVGTDNPGDRRVIGNSTPRYQYGINAGLDYKCKTCIKGHPKTSFQLAQSLSLVMAWNTNDEEGRRVAN